MPTHTPSQDDVTRILRESLGVTAVHVARFPTGLANYVFDVRTSEGASLVVRLARPGLEHVFASALHWYPTLLAAGVPLPELLYAELDERHGLAVMIMQRLPGSDLGLVYPGLPRSARRRLASRILDVQAAVAQLPAGRGFGYASRNDDRDLHPGWADVLVANLARSRARMLAVKSGLEPYADRVQRLLAAHEWYFRTVEPTCFLDDTTTKNVIVSGGELSGIVDVDHVCYGDPLLTLGLTRTSLLSAGHDTQYTDHWAALLELAPAQERTLDLYTVLFVVDFMSELGQQFNRDEAAPVDVAHRARLESLFERFAARCSP